MINQRPGTRCTHDRWELVLRSGLLQLCHHEWAWLDVHDSRSLTHINPRLPAFSYLTWCVSSGLFTSLLDFLVLDMHYVVLSYWCIACFWLLVIQWISGTCWDTMDSLSCSLSTLSRNHFFICFELSNLHSSLTYLVESISTIRSWPQAQEWCIVLLHHSTYLKHCLLHILTSSGVRMSLFSQHLASTASSTH